MSNKSKGKPTASEQQLPLLPRLPRPPHLPLDLLTSWQTDSSLSRSLASCRAAFGIGIEIAIGPGYEARSTDSQWQCNNIATENGKDCKHCMHCILAHFNKKIARRGKNLLAVKARTCSRLLLFWWEWECRGIKHIKFALEMHELIWVSFWQWNKQTMPIATTISTTTIAQTNKVQRKVVASTTVATATVTLYCSCHHGRGTFFCRASIHFLEQLAGTLSWLALLLNARKLLTETSAAAASLPLPLPILYIFHFPNRATNILQKRKRRA